MTISLVSSYVYYKDKLAIGKNNQLLIKLKKDMQFFQNLTMNKIVLMGKNTWKSIPIQNKPLKNRISLILTRDKNQIKQKLKYNQLQPGNQYFISLDQFFKFYNKYKFEVFVVGGEQIYNQFLKISNKLYLTEIKNLNIDSPDAFIPPPGQEFKFIGYSEKYIEKDVNYRILIYKNLNCISQENEYLKLCQNILQNGKYKNDRTNTGTISLFATQLRYNIKEELPLFTSKKVNLKNIIEELLWICRGDTDSKILDNLNVKIWNQNTTQEFIKSRKLKYEKGVAGPIYGWQLRFWNAPYSQEFSDTSKINISQIKGIDQLKYVENLLKTDPMSRRILFSLWNPSQNDEMVLPPCHFVYMWYVEIVNNEKVLNAQLIMRSNDMFLAGCYNNVTISILTMILAKKCGMVPGEIVHTTNDSHIYTNHIQQVKTQLQRKLRPLPKLHIDDSVIKKNWNEISFEDFEIIGYMPHPFISAKMAV